MAGYSRKALAGRLGISGSRVSQMVTSGEIIPPIDSETLDRVWPETYVEDMAARRFGRKASRSIYGFSTQQTQPSRLDDAIVQLGRRQQLFVQLFEVDAGRIGIIATLGDVDHNAAPFYDTLAREGYDHVGSSDPAALVPAIVAAARQFKIDPFDVSWLLVNEIDAAEIVITADSEEQWDAKQVQITWQTAHDKLGMPVPMIDVPTSEAVDAWQRVGRTDALVVLDGNNYGNRAVAAALLAPLVRDRETDQPHMAAALRQAISRLDRQVSWGESSKAVVPPDGSAGDHVRHIVVTANPGYGHLRDDIVEVVVAEEDLQTGVGERQAAADVLGRLCYEQFGPYGQQPTAAIARALEMGIDALIAPIGRRIENRHVQRPRFHELRTFRPMPDRTFWRSYVDQLQPAPGQALNSADGRLLEAQTRRRRADTRVAEARYVVDGDGNLALIETFQGYDGQPYTEVTAIVPISRTNRCVDHLRTFDEIILEPDTQDGPILLNCDGTLHLMPFGSARPGSFTHGYGGAGPSNTIAAIQSFLEWSEGTPMTDAGRDLIRGIVVGADQHQVLQISRGQLIRRDAFRRQ